MVVDKQSHQVICTQIGNGRRHDYHLYKTSKVHIHEQTEAVVDTGYQGIQNKHVKTRKSKKNTKKNPLTKDEKKNNRSINSDRVTVEHVIRRIKIFRIMAERYRNRRKRFGLRLNLIAAIYNYEL